MIEKLPYETNEDWKGQFIYRTEYQGEPKAFDASVGYKFCDDICVHKDILRQWGYIVPKDRIENNVWVRFHKINGSVNLNLKYSKFLALLGIIYCFRKRLGNQIANFSKVWLLKMMQAFRIHD